MNGLGQRRKTLEDKPKLGADDISLAHARGNASSQSSTTVVPRRYDPSHANSDTESDSSVISETNRPRVRSSLTQALDKMERECCIPPRTSLLAHRFLSNFCQSDS
jgi:hypothetical protein